MGIGVELALHLLPLDFIHAMFYRIISLIAVILVAAICYFSALFALGFRLRDFSHKGEF